MRSKGSSLTNYIEAQQKEKYFIFCKSYFPYLGQNNTHSLQEQFKGKII